MNSSITDLLGRWKDGDRAVENQLANAIYPVLRQIASSQLRRNPGHLTLRPTALVSEAYERIADQKDIAWQNREHFFAIAATVLRRVLIDHVRQQSAIKRGSETTFVELDGPESLDTAADGNLVDWLIADQALNQLQELDPAAARVVEMRLFTGLEVAQIAEVTGASPSTVFRQWRFARAWLADALSDRKSSEAPGDGA